MNDSVCRKFRRKKIEVGYFRCKNGDVLDDIEGIKIPTDFLTEENILYAGRGFTGSKNIILPELVQDMRPFIDGDILGICDAKTGELT